MEELSVVLLSGCLAKTSLDAVKVALQNRGFELFSTRPLTNDIASLLPEGFAEGGQAVIAFNPLMKGKQRKANRVFDDFEVEKAAHLLATVIDDAHRNLRIATNANQATRIAQSLLTSSEMQALETRISKSFDALLTTEPVLSDLSRFKYRAKVELIDHNGTQAVKKTFRSTAYDARDRELAFFDDMAAYSDVPATVLSRTENAFVLEYIENGLETHRFFGFRVPIPLPLAVVRELAAFVHLIAERGWDPIDLTPGNNILIDRNTGKLRSIDFEFAHKRQSPVSAQDSFFISGVPEEAKVARPLNNAMEQDPYPNKWRPYTGLSKSSFLNDPEWLQQAKRLVVHPMWLVFHVLASILRRRRYAKDRDDLLRAIALTKKLPPK